MKHNLWKRIISLFLTLTMALGLFPVGVLAAGVPETLVTSLTELYSGDEERARADLEALYAAGLLDDDGRLVDLDIREDGGSVELSALVERITNGETVGALTVNGNAATPEQIVQISQVKAAIEVAQLMDEEIDVTDEHVNNLESLLNGIQDGSVDLENALRTGSMSLQSANAFLLTAAGNDLPETNTGTGSVEAADGKYTAPYISGKDYEASHSFTLADPNNTTWYTKSVVPSDGSSKYHITGANWFYRDKYGPSDLTNNGTTIPKNANYTPTGVVYYMVLDVSTWNMGNDVITFDRTVSDAVTLDDPYNQFDGSPYSGTITYKKLDYPTDESPVIDSNLNKDNNNLWSGTQCIVVNANNIKNATFPGGKKTWNSMVYYERGDNVAVTQFDSLAAESISVTAGTYCPENVVPITVTLAGYATAPAGTTLKVNGRDCPMLNTAGTKARKFTFGYTLNEVDAATLNITELTGLVNASGNPITVSEGIQKSIGREQGVILSTPFKTSSIDLDSVKYGIDDAGRQTVTVLLPFKSDAQKTWVTNDLETIIPAVTMSFPGYENASVGGYLKNAYFSMDGGATRYPVYVIGEADALAVRFVPPNNVYDALRKDTITLFLDDNSETNYLGTWADDKQTDSGGFAYFAATENSAPAVSGRSYSYYVKSCIAFDENETIERRDYVEANVMEDESGEPLGFYKDGEKYVAVQGSDASKQHDVELWVNEALYNAASKGVRAEEAGDLLLSYQCSNRKKFTFTAPECFSYSTSDPKIAEVVKDEETGAGHIVLTGAGGEVTITVTVGNGSDDKKYDLNLTLKLLEGKTPFLNIPSSSRERMGLTDKDVDVMFASNVTERNAAVGKNTTFNAKLYEVSKVGDTPTGNAVWSGNFGSTIKNTLTHITVPARETPGIYAVVISTKYEGGEADGVMTEAKDFSATAYLNVKQAPVKVTLDKLERYSAAFGEIPAITYKVNSQNAKVEYTVQKSGEAVSTRKEVTDGTIPFAPSAPAGLKEAYTITVYARNPGDEAWSTDSMMFTVYNGNALDVIVSDVKYGAIGGTTGGSGEGAKGTTIKMDNHGKLEKYGITDRDKYQLNVTDLDALRTDMSLQKVISANYGSGAWGLLSDKMQWKSGDSSKVSVNYEQSGIYSDINSYSYTSYVPATDFLLVGKDDTDGVDIEVTHTATGKKASVKVTADTLKDQLYVFRFNPQVETDVIYTNGADEKRTLKSDENGVLVVYEPEGFKGDIMVMSVKDSDTYVGTINSKELQSGERDIAALRMYPCNNLTLRKVSDCTLTFLKPDGKPYTGKVILRGGVYAGDEYCPEAKIRTEKNISSHQYLREDIEFTTNKDGKTTVYFDPTQFTSESGKTWVNGLKYVFEYRFEDSYQPGYVIVNSSLNNPAESIVNLKTMRGSGKAPTIVRQEYKQFLNGTTPTNYTRNVVDYMDNIGISPNFPKAELYTDIVVLGETVGTDEKGYSSISGANALSFALCVSGGENDGKSLTGQTDLSEGKTITKLSDLNNANFFVFPFSAVPMLRSTYTMTNENLKADGIDDTAKTPTARIKAVFRRGGLTVRSMNMPFGVTNVSNQPNLTSSTAGAAAVGKEVRENLRETTDIGAIFRSINVNDMIRKGFVFLGNLAGAGGNNPVNLMILPTQDPATFRIIAFIGANQRGGEDVGDGVSVNFNAQDLAEDMTKFKKEMEELNKKKDDENDSGGESSMKFNFYGTIILEAHAGVTDGKWDIAFRGGNVGTNVKGKYEWGQTFFCGPYPAFISFETGFHADLEVAFGNKAAARAMLLDATLGVSVEAFAGLGFDLSIVALQLGIYGRIGADVNFLLLTPSDASNMNGTKLTIDGEIGLKLKVKLLFISYSKNFASTGFNWTKKWNNYDQIKQYWNNQGFGVINGVTAAGRAYAMYLFADGSTIVEIEGRAELEDRDYLELAERAWTGGAASGRRLLRSAGPIETVQTNAYPYSHPAFTDDGELFLYVSDNDNADDVQSVVSYAVKSGTGYANSARVDISEGNVLADLDVVASGTKENAFAAWVKQLESPDKEMHDEVTNDELAMMFNATEIYAGSYAGSDWKTERLTDNSVADMAPTVASSGNKAVVAWRSMSASSMSEDGTDAEDITAMFDVENNINYRYYDGTEWKTAQVAYNGASGTVNAIDSAMLPDGTAILVYTVRTGEDVSTTETFYTVIGTDGNAVTTGRLTSDSYTDTNAQVTAVNEGGGYFVLGWYSEHDAGEGMTAEYDDKGNATQKAVVAHDIRLARINANGSYDIDFPESIGGSGETGISSDFHFSAPVNNNDLTNVSIVWSQKKDSDKAEDAGKYELNAVRFFKAAGVTGLTAPTDIAETDKNYTIDRFDTYTDNDGAIHAIILGSDYDKIEGIEKYDSIDLNNVSKELGENESNSNSPNNLDILDGEAISSLKLAKGTFPETAADVTADINISEVIPGFTTPVQFTVTNKGTSVLDSVKATVGEQSKDFTGLNLLPNQSATLLMSYDVPEGAVSDAEYSVTSGGVTLGSGTLALNRPDVGISGIKLLQEYEGKRDIQVMLANGSEIPLAGSGKTVKLAFYKDPFHESMIGSEISINADDYADIDAGTYTTVQTLNVTDIAALVDGEIPDEGLTVYARAWVKDTEEPDVYNNDNYLSFTGLLARNNGQKLTTDTSVEENEGGYTVYADIRNNSMKETNVGTPVALLLDESGEVIAQKNFRSEPLSLTKERSEELSVAFTASDIGDKTPARAVVGSVCTVTFDLNGGSGNKIDPVQTNLEGHIILPKAQPTPPTGGAEQLFFGGWYTAAEGGERITESYTFTSDTTVYAHYVNHQHDFTYSTDGATITATCAANNCYLAEHTATLTIAAPEGAIVYNGSTHPAVITDTNGIQGSAKVLYAAKGEDGTYGEAVETEPVNVGTYRASITLGDATACVEYTIAKATWGSTAESSGDEKAAKISGMANYTYGQSEPLPTPGIPAALSGTAGAQTTFYYSTSATAETGTVWENMTATTLKPGPYYLWAVTTSTNYTDTATPRKGCVFVVNKGTQAAPTIGSIIENVVTIGSYDETETYEYAVAKTNGTPTEYTVATPDADGKFTLYGLTGGQTYYLNLRVKATANGLYDASDAVKQSFTAANIVSVVYDANGGSGTVPATQTGADIRAASGSGISRAGYTFQGWSTDKSAAEASFQPGDAVSQSCTLYAVWKGNAYTVRFNANGVTGTMEDESFTYGEAKALNNNTFARDDYTFVGWATTAGGTMRYANEQSVKNLATSGSITLYAVWAENTYTVNVTAQQTTGNGTEEKANGATVKLMRGDAKVQEKTSGSDGVYTFTEIPAGTYNLVVTNVYDGKTRTVTEMVTVTPPDEGYTVTLNDVILPFAEVSAEVKVTGTDTPAVMVSGLNSEAETRAEDNKNVVMTMAIEEQDESSLTGTPAKQAETQEAIDAIKDNGEASGKTLSFLNIDVTKTTYATGTSTSPESEIPITETNNVIRINIPYDFAGKTNVRPFRYHDGTVTPMVQGSQNDGGYKLDEANGLITLFTKQFSTYAIGYNPDATDSGSGNNGNNGGSGAAGGGTTYAPTISNPSNGTVSIHPTSPKAGDKVTITAKPDEGYAVDTVSVTDANGKAVSVTEVNDTTYTFTQPNSKVKIDVTFKAVSKTDALARFVDVNASDWYADAVRWAVDNGVMNGWANPLDAGMLFGPNDTTTRAMVATMLWRLEGSPVVSGEMKFVDVADGTWYTEAIRWASGAGIITGSKIPAETTPWPMGFRPDDAVTREQLAAMLYRYAQYKKADVSASASLSSYGDAQTVSGWATSAMQWAVSSGIINGIDSNLVPAGKATRAQVATMLMRYSTEK